MIIAINFADKKYRAAQHLNSRTAKLFGADRVIEYSPKDIDRNFYERNIEIFRRERGYGCWLWKPYFILKTLQSINENDYLIYTDSGSAFVNNISFLIDVMERDKTDIMCFCIGQIERMWDKRDVIIAMDADKDEYLDTNQICGGYIVIKKSEVSVEVIKEYLKLAQDPRLITDDPNVLGFDNYPEFKEHRHDQSIWSLLCKKRGIIPYRDPSQFGLNETSFPRDVIQRSNYPQIIESHRCCFIRYKCQLAYYNKACNMICKKIWEIYWLFRSGIRRIKSIIIK